jgi:purine-binding chemotaxis protein CheW
VSEPQDIARILEERAAVLARSPVSEETGEQATGMVVLGVGEERYGVDIRDVQEVEPLDAITAIPGTPPFWAGIVNLRGSMFPVLDLERYLGLPVSEGAKDPKVALVARHGLTVGLLVDEVAEIREVRASEIGPPVAEGSSRPGAVRGVTSDLLSILDLEVLLADPALVVEDEVS